MKCNICNYSACSIVKNLFDDRYGYPGVFRLMACPECGYSNIDYSFSPEEIRGLYSNYYPRAYMDEKKHSIPRMSRGVIGWLNGEKCAAYFWVPEKVRVLDIGCGFCESLGYYTSRGCDAYGVEADTNAKRVADKYGYKLDIGLFTPSNFKPAFFDYVTMSQVIEHVVDPDKTLTDIAGILKVGGKLVLTTPNGTGWGARIFGRYWINWHAPYHLHIFSKKSMQITASQAGFEVECVKTITSSEWLKYQWAHCVTHSKTQGVPSSFWAPNQKAPSGRKLLLALIGALHRTKINHLVTRVFDSLGIGDNLVFVLRKIK